jgi:hypothetical protein
MLATSSPQYAHTDRSKTYHLMGSKSKTLCGLSVLPVLFESDFNVPLHLVTSPPASCLVCKHCSRAKENYSIPATATNHLLKSA